MSESGEQRPKGQLIGRMEDVDGVPITFSLNYDGTVRIEIGSFAQYGVPQTTGMADFDRQKSEEFSRLHFQAIRQAESNAAGKAKATMPP